MRSLNLLWIIPLICLAGFGFQSIRHNNTLSYNSYTYGTFTLQSGRSLVDFLWTIAEEARYQEQGFDAAIGKNIHKATYDLPYSASENTPLAYSSFFSASPDVSTHQFGLDISVPYFWLILSILFLWIWVAHRQRHNRRINLQQAPLGQEHRP